MRSLRRLALATAFACAPSAAHAFCGFYVANARGELFNHATTVALMRDGTRTVLSMRNDYQGPPERFAMVVPVPVVLRREDVRTLPAEVFTRLDSLAAPRLVEYWERDPCQAGYEGDMFGGTGLGLTGIGFGGGGVGQGFGVRVEAQFAVGEYDVVVLSASDSAGLDAWLRQERYNIPAGAGPVLEPYVRSGMKFFVARVDPARVHFVDGHATLSPLRFHYDAPNFELPIRLGQLNSPGVQDLVVHILARGQRYEVANRPNVFVPTNLDVDDRVRGDFPRFYAALYDHVVAQHPGAAVTEYAWQARSCDPCPVDPLTSAELATLGADVPAQMTAAALLTQPQTRLGAPIVNGPLPPEAVRRVILRYLSQLRYCHEQRLAQTPGIVGRVTPRFIIDGSGRVTDIVSQSTIADPTLVRCVESAVRRWTFPMPEDGARVMVTAPITFALDPGGRRWPRGDGTQGFVLTRIHLRYGRNDVGDDLVFRAAEAVSGGREDGAAASLRTDATPASDNTFQARYAIRHPWTGAVACEHPERGRWGGPPPGVDAGTPRPAAPALGTAFAHGGNVDLRAMLRRPLGDAATPPPDAAVPPPAAPIVPVAPVVPARPQPAARSGCGRCATTAGDGRVTSRQALWLLGAVALLTRRRSARPRPLANL